MYSQPLKFENERVYELNKLKLILDTYLKKNYKKTFPIHSLIQQVEKNNVSTQNKDKTKTET